MIKGIVWTKSNWKRVSNYNAKIGNIQLACRPSMKYLRGNKRRIIGWTCLIYFADRQIGHTTREKSLEIVKKEAEELATEYLLGDSHVVLKALKRTGFLEYMLSEIGVDI